MRLSSTVKPHFSDNSASVRSSLARKSRRSLFESTYCSLEIMTSGASEKVTDLRGFEAGLSKGRKETGAIADAGEEATPTRFCATVIAGIASESFCRGFGVAENGVAGTGTIGEAIVEASDGIAVTRRSFVIPVRAGIGSRILWPGGRNGEVGTGVGSTTVWSEEATIGLLTKDLITISSSSDDGAEEASSPDQNLPLSSESEPEP